MPQHHMGISPAAAVRSGVPDDELIHLWKLTPREIAQLRQTPQTTPARPDATRANLVTRLSPGRKRRRSRPIRPRRRSRNLS